MKNTQTKKNIQTNILFRRVASVLAVSYGVIIFILAYLSLYYNAVIDDKISFFVLNLGITIFFVTLMIFSRKQVITKIVTMCCMIALLPIILFDFGEWALVIPISVGIIAMFFICGATDKTKTILGTIFLIYYIFGALAYFLTTTLFVTETNEVVVQAAKTSESGDYRCYVADSYKKSAIGTRVYVEPNDYDIENAFLEFEATGYKRRVFVDNSAEREEGANLKLEWKTETRDSIVAHLLEIAPEVEMSLDKEQKKLLGYKDEDKVYLKNMTAESFKKLGIPETGDVLYVDGEVRFRYFTAIMEKMFDHSKREIEF